MHLRASKILQNVAALKGKKKKELVWHGFEPPAVEVVKNQLKEIDGEGEAVDTRERALHREATVALDFFQILDTHLRNFFQMLRRHLKNFFQILDTLKKFLSNAGYTLKYTLTNF